MEDLIKQLALLEAAKKDLKKVIDAKKQEICDKRCPVKIGDTVEINTYGHNGKKMVISHIFYEPDNWMGGDFRCLGNVLRKDGTQGSNRGTYTCKVTELEK